MKSIAKGIIVILAVMLFLGSMAIGVSPDQSVKAKFTGTVSTINQNFNERLPYETIWADPIMNSPHKSVVKDHTVGIKYMRFICYLTRDSNGEKRAKA